MAIANKPKPKELCPRCYKAGIENELKYRPGGGVSHQCSNGHQWDDRDLLATELMEMAHARAAAMPVSAPEPKLEPDPQPIVQDTRLKIEDVDRERLKSILGDFTDSSSLFGCVFALNEELKSQKELLQRAQDRLNLASVKQIGGDVPITIMVPERHVQPVRDVAESSGMSMERFLNARMEDFLDNAWVY